MMKHDVVKSKKLQTFLDKYNENRNTAQNHLIKGFFLPCLSIL